MQSWGEDIWGPQWVGLYQMIELVVWDLSPLEAHRLGSWKLEGRGRGSRFGWQSEGGRWGRAHRPGVPEGHAHEAVGQRQVSRGRPGLLGVDGAARTQRHAQGARGLGGLVGDSGLQADPKEEATGTAGAAGGPRGPWTRSWPERVDLQLEDTGRLCLGWKGTWGEGDARTPPHTHTPPSSLPGTSGSHP